MGGEYRYDTEYGNGYSYDTYSGSGEVGGSENSDSGVDLNETNDFTNNEIRDSLGASESEYSKSLASDEGVDLNAGAVGDAGVGGIEPTNSDVGKDLNDSGADAVLENFQEDKWSDLSLEEQKQSMTDLADHVAADTGNDNPPEIVFRSDMEDGSYGGYNPDTNTMEINENMLDDSAEAADTIAHEMWHAHQEQAANDPSNPRAQEYREGFDNYISPEYDFEAYENQMVEAEARDYAQGYKDRLAGMKGAA
jgi:hypothetical protein